MSRFTIVTRFLVLLLTAQAASSHGICAPRSDAERPVTGEGIIDRVIATGSVPVFRAGGYTFRITSATDVRLARGLTALNDVGTNTWAIFEGKLDGSGVIVASKAAFTKLKLPGSKPDPNAVQLTTFSPGGEINADTGLVSGPKAFPPEDQGGWCGWYDIYDNPAKQEDIRRLGIKIVPQYQRDLASDDPAKIPFRFYVVEEKEIRSEIFCRNGLILVPAEVINRIQSEDQLAAVLADGVAGELQLQVADARGFGFTFTRKEAAELAAAGLLGFGGVPAALGNTGILVEQHEVGRSVEHRRERMALAFLADAGFDPRQAPEAWRLLAPYHLPKDVAHLKYPERSVYLQKILEVQYKEVLSGNAPETDRAATVAPGVHTAAPNH